jgi:uncharacterized protein
MLGWFQALMPKEERFFELFTRHAELTVAGAEELRGLLQGDGNKVEFHCRNIFEREAQADEITRQVLTAVRRTFITPFDRSDIQDLITSMDDAIDQMNKTAKAITLFEIRVFEPQMQQMGDIILKAGGLVLEAVPLLSSIGKNAGQLNVLTEKIIRVEEDADQLHDQGLKALFVASQGNADGSAMRLKRSSIVSKTSRTRSTPSLSITFDGRRRDRSLPPTRQPQPLAAYPQALFDGCPQLRNLNRFEQYCRRMVRANSRDRCLIGRARDKNNRGLVPPMNFGCRVNAVRLSFKTHIHEHNIGSMSVGKLDCLSRS